MGLLVLSIVLQILFTLLVFKYRNNVVLIIAILLGILSTILYVYPVQAEFGGMEFYSRITEALFAISLYSGYVIIKRYSNTTFWEPVKYSDIKSAKADSFVDKIFIVMAKSSIVLAILSLLITGILRGYK